MFQISGTATVKLKFLNFKIQRHNCFLKIPAIFYLGNVEIQFSTGKFKILTEYILIFEFESKFFSLK